MGRKSLQQLCRWVPWWLQAFVIKHKITLRLLSILQMKEEILNRQSWAITYTGNSPAMVNCLAPYALMSFMYFFLHLFQKIILFQQQLQRELLHSIRQQKQLSPAKTPLNMVWAFFTNIKLLEISVQLHELSTNAG